MSTQKVTDASFESDVLAQKGAVLVDFWAEWCAPCKMIAPALEEIGQQLAGKLSVVKMNIDENPATPMKYGVQAIPTLILFENGQAKAKRQGALPKGQLMQWVQGAL